MRRFAARMAVVGLMLSSAFSGCSGDDGGSTGKDGKGGAGSGGKGSLDGSAAWAGAAGFGSDATSQATFDIVIVGAGSGGIAAAIAAARLGVKVLLVEATDWVGGQMTAAAVSTMDGGNAPPGASGIYAEMQSRIKAYYADTQRFPPSGKSIGTCYWSAGTTCFEPSVGRKILTEMIGETSIELRTRTRVVSVERDANVVRGVTLSDGTAVTASVVVDATEAGDVLPLAGARYRVGNTDSDAPNAASCIQSLTYVAVIRRYSGGPPTELVMSEPPPGYAANKPFYTGVVVATGSETIPIAYPVSIPFHHAYRGLPDSKNPSSYVSTEWAKITRTGVNWANDFPPLDYATTTWSDTLTIAYLEDQAVRRDVDCKAKLLTLGFVYYLQQDLGQTEWSVANDEGFDTPYNVEDNHCADITGPLVAFERHLPVMPYIRESRRIVPVDTLTAKEIDRVAGIAVSNFERSIAIGEYGTDLHNCNSDATLESSLGEVANDGSDGGLFQVPFETLIPETIDGLLAAEKNIGVTRLTNGAIRLQPITMATGQAVGVLAALASSGKMAPRAVRAVDVQRELLAQKSALSRYDFADVPVTHALWKSVQLVSTYEVMIGSGDGSFHPDDTLTRAQAAVVVANLFSLDTKNPPATPSFGDVPATHWAYPFVEAVYKAGITAGCSASPLQYCPDAITTRAALAAFLVKGLKLDQTTAPTTPIFTDVPATHPQFASIQLAADAGLFQGCSSQPKQFCPDQAATRGAAAVGGYGVLIR